MFGSFNNYVAEVQIPLTLLEKIENGKHIVTFI